MSEQWRGLYGDHPLHERILQGQGSVLTADCAYCDTWCLPEYHCRCCLASEMRARFSPESIHHLVQQANIITLDTLVEVMQESRGEFATYNEAIALVIAARNRVASGSALTEEEET